MGRRGRSSADGLPPTEVICAKGTKERIIITQAHKPHAHTVKGEGKDMTIWDDFHGPNAGYVLDLYERYQQTPTR